MPKKICLLQEHYQCQVMGGAEIATIETTTTEVIGRGRQNHGKVIARTDSHVITNCTGLENCGVKTVHGRGASFDWKLCPLMQSLKTGR